MNYRKRWTGVNKEIHPQHGWTDDKQPIFSYCCECGEPIIAENDLYAGQEYIEVIEGDVHWDCFCDYARHHRKEARC